MTCRSNFLNIHICQCPQNDAVTKLVVCRPHIFSKTSFICILEVKWSSHIFFYYWRIFLSLNTTILFVNESIQCEMSFTIKMRALCLIKSWCRCCRVLIVCLYHNSNALDTKSTSLFARQCSKRLASEVFFSNLLIFE